MKTKAKETSPLNPSSAALTVEQKAAGFDRICAHIVKQSASGCDDADAAIRFIDEVIASSRKAAADAQLFYTTAQGLKRM